LCQREEKRREEKREDLLCEPAAFEWQKQAEASRGHQICQSGGPDTTPSKMLLPLGINI